MKNPAAYFSILIACTSLSHSATLAGTGTLSFSNSVAGPSGTFFFTVTDSIPEGSISYDIVVSSTGADNITKDVNVAQRGFGESGSGGPEFRAATDTMAFSFSSPTIVPAAGFSIGSFNVHFDSFTLVANGGNPPSVTWTTPENPGGGTTNTGSSPSSTVETGVDGGSIISITAASNWSWINDAATSYNVEFVPEPSSALLGFLGLSLLARRKR